MMKCRFEWDLWLIEGGRIQAGLLLDGRRARLVRHRALYGWVDALALTWSAG